jgi:hypothetical protein
MLRISLSGPPNRRIQPERYMQCALNWFENNRNKNYLNKEKEQDFENIL